MIQLKPFQEIAVNSLIKHTRMLIQSPGSDMKFVFKAPTGSGKTIMTAEYLKRLTNEDWATNLVFIWVSLYDLHTQSREKLKDYLLDSSYSLKALEELGESALADNTIVFVNWHSLTTQKTNPDTNEKEWANIYVKDREDGKSIVSILEKTRLAGKQLVLIVDEAHRNYLTANSQKFISEVFQPRLTLEVSATPLLEINPEDLVNKKAGFVSVPFSEAVASGLIKQETVINQDLGSLALVAKSADELVVQSALDKRFEISQAFRSSNVRVNPLILIQLPSETEKTSALDSSVREEVERLLEDKGVSYENGKLAVWLSEDKRNLSLIERNDSPVEVLIFKEAVAIGWDCPRAQILVMLREIRSITFEIQTVGRILRTPEAKHYDLEILNKAFIYTNIPAINVNAKPEDLDFFKTKFAKKKDSAIGVSLPSKYLHRQEYGDLTASFSNLLVQALNDRLGIRDSDMQNDAIYKADAHLDLSVEELKMPVISDVVVANLDQIQAEIGSLDFEYIQANVSAANIEKEFNYLLKAWCLPYAPVRSFSKVKTGIYKWFKTIDYSPSRWNEIQRIIACSARNQKVFADAIAVAKDKYEALKISQGELRKDTTETIYVPPVRFMAGEKHVAVALKKYGYEPAFLLANRSDPEKRLEEVLDASDKVLWWIKNGEGQQQFFSIVYSYVDAESGLNRIANFYPDFIAVFTDGTIGIYETKSGMTLTDKLTHAKSDALQEYLASNEHLRLTGGIVNSRPTGLFLFSKPLYTPEQSQWERLTF